MASVWYIRMKNYSSYGLALSVRMQSMCDCQWPSDAPDDWLVSPGISALAPHAAPAVSAPIVPGTERPVCATSSSAHCSGPRSLPTWLPSLGRETAGCEEKMHALYPNSCHRTLAFPYPTHHKGSKAGCGYLSSAGEPGTHKRCNNTAPNACPPVTTSINSWNASAGPFTTHPFGRPKTSQRRACKQQEPSLSWCVCHDEFSCG